MSRSSGIVGPPCRLGERAGLSPGGPECNAMQAAVALRGVVLVAGQEAAGEEDAGDRGGELDRRAVDQGVTLRLRLRGAVVT